MNIDTYVEEYKRTSGAVLLDVRTAAEYDAGHIPGSVNIPLDEIADTEELSEEEPLFVYCRSGRRSGEAALILNSRGYHAKNIGGILDYTGVQE